MRGMLIGVLALFGSGPALAQETAGDPAAGEAHFADRCVECHYLESDAGEVLVGSKPKSGPNLHGLAGRVPASFPGVFYSVPLRAYGATGVTWDEASFIGYVQDPTGFLQQATGEAGRGRMPSGLVTEEEAHDLWAYLAAFSPSDGKAGATVSADGEPATE